MTVAVHPRRAPTYHSLFPSLEPVRPLAWFFAEQLLEARAESDLPTNSRGPDEAINVYLVGLLGRWIGGATAAGVAPAQDPAMLHPPNECGRHALAEYWRRQADHRLLALGLFDRGDMIRRRPAGWRQSRAETRRRDLSLAGHCYRMAARYIGGREESSRGLAEIWSKLAADLPAYVQVLQTLARRRLGLGARLSDAALSRLLDPV